MDIIFASPTSHTFALENQGSLSVLCSFANDSFNSIMKVIENTKINIKTLFIDSGAFSVWTKGRAINIEDYILFAKKIQKECNLRRPSIKIYFINLDVIPGKFGIKPNEKERETSAYLSYNNLKKLELSGVNPLPVFHQHENFKWLERINAEYNYYCISPANDVSLKKKIKWLDKVFYRVSKGKKIHGLAVTSKTLLQKYPWYSCDSTSWKAIVCWGRSVMPFSLKKRGYTKTSSRICKIKIIDEVKFLIKLRNEITLLWEKRGVKWED